MKKIHELIKDVDARLNNANDFQKFLFGMVGLIVTSMIATLVTKLIDMII